MDTNPRVGSSSLLDFTPSLPAVMAKEPSATFTQSLPRSPSSLATTVIAPPVTTRSSLEFTP